MIREYLRKTMIDERMRKVELPVRGEDMMEVPSNVDVRGQTEA